VKSPWDDGLIGGDVTAIGIVNDYGHPAGTWVGEHDVLNLSAFLGRTGMA